MGRKLASIRGRLARMLRELPMLVLVPSCLLRRMAVPVEYRRLTVDDDMDGC